MVILLVLAVIVYPLRQRDVSPSPKAGTDVRLTFLVYMKKERSYLLCCAVLCCAVLCCAVKS